ncbi:MAG: hypothetical protein HAW67_03825, partial [Endozoicomonadaceae bacterium]|nr:hypothetical protein [Endozoicomonadaceae bacterium]
IAYSNDGNTKIIFGGSGEPDHFYAGVWKLQTNPRYKIGVDERKMLWFHTEGQNHREYNLEKVLPHTISKLT